MQRSPSLPLMRSCLWGPVFVLLAGPNGYGQQLPDTIKLHDVVITAPQRADFASGVKVQVIDSTALARFRFADLGNLLEQESPLFIKNYGPGSLATSSFRGGSANHTAVLWNGFNIGSPMNGQVDLSLVPVGIADNVIIQYGGGSALWGSGAVGGSILLNNKPVFNGGLTVEGGASCGSFGDQRQRVGISISKPTWIGSVDVFNTSSRNDFEYVNTEEHGSPKLRQQHAELAQQGLLAENYFRINARQRINARFWYQRNDRNIPPTLMEQSSTASQQDESCRATTEWQRTGDRVNSYVRAAWFDERLNWHGTGTDSAAFSRAKTLIAEAEVRIKLNNDRQRINIGLNNTYAQAISDGYPDEPRQNRTALFASCQFADRKRRSTTTVSLRQEVVGGDPAPFTWSLGSEYQLAHWLQAMANIARIYRLPTFNDLYWTPGGNRDLLPEIGYSGEAGLAAKGEASAHVSITAGGTVFQRTMDNWIIWLPSGAYWSPENIMNVWSRGVEMRGEIAWHAGTTTVKLSAWTNYVVSTNQRAKAANDASVGKQLIYVPMYSGHGKLSVAHGPLHVSVGANYTGYRYTSTDNRSFLDPYLLADAAVSYRIAAGKKCSASLLAQAFNLLNADYQVMLNRPMPMRSFQVGVNVRFHQPNAIKNIQP